MSNAILLDQEKSSQYLANPWDKKYELGLFFSYLLDNGVDVIIEIETIKNNVTKTYNFHHALHDGFSAVKKIIEKEKIDFKLQYPQLRPSPGLFKPIFQALKSNSKPNPQYKNQLPYSNSTNGLYLIRKIPKKNLGQILSVCNRHLLQELSYAQRVTWMIPCRVSNSPGLQASYIGLEISKNESGAQVHNSLKSKLKIGEHYGFLYLAKMILTLGKFGVYQSSKSVLRKDNPTWFGSFSHLGDLGTSEDLDEIIIKAPIRWHRPIGIVSYQFNGEHYLIFGYHESLNENNLLALTDKVVDELTNLS